MMRGTTTRELKRNDKKYETKKTNLEFFFKNTLCGFASIAHCTLIVMSADSERDASNAILSLANRVSVIENRLLAMTHANAIDAQTTNCNIGALVHANGHLNANLGRIAAGTTEIQRTFELQLKRVEDRLTALEKKHAATCTQIELDNAANANTIKQLQDRAAADGATIELLLRRVGDLEQGSV
jgi:hypothetical protein